MGNGGWLRGNWVTVIGHGSTKEVDEEGNYWKSVPVSLISLAMSHQLIAATTRRVTRSARRYTPPVRELQVDIDADVADQPSAPAAAPPAAGRRSPSPTGRRNASPASSQGGSEWEAEQELASDASSEESDIEDMDYVSLHNSSIDSDEPLSDRLNRAFQRKIARNAPGTDNFKWAKEENFPRRHGFSGTPGVQLGH